MAKSTTKKNKAGKSSDQKKGSARKVKSPVKGPARGDVSTFEPFRTLRKQVDDLFTNFTVSWPHFEMPKIEWPVLAGEGKESAIARFDLSENGNAVKVVADIPGMDEKDVEVLVRNGVLTIKGEKKSEREEEGEDFYVSERSFGSFSRAFRLPDGVDEQAVAAKFDKGVLTVDLPKIPKTKTEGRRIPVIKK
jgi:HSP20 family protein